MTTLTKEVKQIIIFTLIVTILSVTYYIYADYFYVPLEDNDTFLVEVGEGFGEISLWLLLFIYFRTFIKLLMGKGPISKRLLPEYSPTVDLSLLNKLIHFLDKTHLYFGVGAVAVIFLHILFVGLHAEILFFPAVLVLVIWQGLFGVFISWRVAPKELKKFSYVVHAQLFTGIMIGIFSYLGHVLIDK